MIRFQNKDIALGKGQPDLGGGAPQVGGDAELESGFGIPKGNRHRVSGIVGCQEWFHRERSDGEREASPVGPEVLSTPEQVAAGIPSRVGDEDGSSVTTGEYPHPSGVVAVVVGDDDAIDFFRKDPQEPQSFFQGFGAEPSIHQDPGISAGDQNGVSPAPASEDSYLHP